MGRDSIVSVASRCRLDGLGIDRGRGEIPAPVQTDHGAHQMGTVSFLGVKRPERGVSSHAYLEPRLKND